MVPYEGSGFGAELSFTSALFEEPESLSLPSEATGSFATNVLSSSAKLISESDMVTELTFQQSNVIELLKSHLLSQQEALKTLESKARHNFTIINIIAAIIVGFNFGLSGTNDLRLMVGERPLLLLSVVMYVVIAILSLRILYVKEHATYPMNPSRSNIEAWSNCSLSDHYEVLSQSYLLVYESNAKIVDSKGVLLKTSHRLLTASILVLVLDSAQVFPSIAALPGS